MDEARNEKLLSRALVSEPFVSEWPANGHAGQVMSNPVLAFSVGLKEFDRSISVNINLETGSR